MSAIYSAISSVIAWLAGNGKYMLLTHCMGHDTFWIVTTVALDLANAAGYAVIAVHWWRNARYLGKVPAKRVLGNIRNIFVFCGICGYLFIPIKMIWPAWRLYDIVLAVLVFYTWRYALGARDLKVVYSAIGRSTKLQEDLQRSVEESRRKSLFLNAVSHDLRTPLNGLVLQTNLAEMCLDDTEALKFSLAEMRTSIAATTTLLDSLLEFARVDWSEDKNNLASHELREIIAEVVGPQRLLAEQKGIDVQVKCPVVHITTDRAKLERVLSNLVSNAVKFTERGEIRVLVESSSQGTEIHVIDSGIGIDPEDQKILFQEFFQIHNTERDRKKGFGLGLAISRRLARQIGGDLTLESAVGSGSRFTIVLPITPQSERPKLEPAKPAQSETIAA